METLDKFEEKGNALLREQERFNYLLKYLSEVIDKSKISTKKIYTEIGMSKSTFFERKRKGSWTILEGMKIVEILKKGE